MARPSRPHNDSPTLARASYTSRVSAAPTDTNLADSSTASICSLPPELIEQICEYASKNEYFGNSISHFRGFRQSCKYLQEASRRTFLRYGFSTQRVWPVPKHMRHLTRLAQRKDLAESVRTIMLRCPDDQLPDLCGLEDSINPPGPVLYEARMNILRSDAMISALRKFTNLEHILISDDMTNLEDEFNSEYHVQRRQMPTNNYHNEFVSDITTSFNLFVDALGASGSAPISLTVTGVHQGMMHAGPSDCSAMLRYPGVFRNLQCMSLVFPYQGLEPDAARELGVRIGDQLAQAMSNMPSLNELALNFQRTPAGKTALHRLSQAQVQPPLETLTLKDTNADFNDWIAIIAKHSDTIIRLELEHIRFESASFATIRHGWFQLLDCPKLKWISWLLAFVVAWEERVVKQLNTPDCHDLIDSAGREICYDYLPLVYMHVEPQEDEELEVDDSKLLKDWVGVDRGVDWWCCGGEEYVQEGLLGFIESYGGLPWAD